MTKQAVNYDLKRLVGFLNLSDGRLDAFDRNEARPHLDSSDETLALLCLRYCTWRDDDAESLKKLRDDIQRHLSALLDPEIPAEKAVNGLLVRIYEIRLSAFRRIYDPKRDQSYEPQKIDIVRILPAKPLQEGKQRPTINDVRVIEVDYNDSAAQTFYRFVDNALRQNTIWHVRRCLQCKKFYIEMRKLTYCSKGCETAFNNERKRQKRLHIKKELNAAAKKQRATAAKNQILDAFDDFLTMANGDAKNQEKVGAIIKKLGKGDLRKGWKIVDPWLGKPAVSIWRTLDQNTRQLLNSCFDNKTFSPRQ